MGICAELDAVGLVGPSLAEGSTEVGEVGLVSPSLLVGSRTKAGEMGGGGGGGCPSLLSDSDGVREGDSGSSGDLEFRSEETHVRRIDRGLATGASSIPSTGNLTVKIDPPLDDSTAMIPPIRSTAVLVKCKPVKGEKMA